MAKKRKNREAQKLGRRGGIARRIKLTPEERTEIARKAGKASAEKRKQKKEEHERKNN